MSENAAAFAGSSAAAPPPNAKSKYKVIIIGAGMAGLSAANHLIKNGISNFKILEACNRVGGRILSIDMAMQKVSIYKFISFFLSSVYWQVFFLFVLFPY